MNNRRLWLTVGGAVAAVVVLAVAWYLVSPLFINRQVNEDLPVVGGGTVATVTPPTPEAAPTHPQAAAPTATAAPPIAAPTTEQQAAATPTLDRMAEATAAMQDAMAAPTQPMAEPMPADTAAGLELLAQGSFYNVVHDGMGMASVYRLADGSRVLRLQDFQVLNGPDLHVYLVPDDPVPNSIGSEIAGSVDLGKLKGNIGNQNYPLPADLDLAGVRSVVIWCQPFRVPFIAAALQTH